MKDKAHGQSKFVRIMMSPIRALTKARDCYVRSVMECGQSAGSGNYMGYPGAEFSALPRSFSASSSMQSGNEDFRELIRAASANRLGNKIDIDAMLSEDGMGGVGSKGFAKSSSVGMGRIDEDKACDFGEGGDFDLKYQRSRSYVLDSRTPIQY